MPLYEVTDPSTGVTLELEGDSPPNEQELEQVFASVQPQNESALSGELGVIQNPLGGVSTEKSITVTDPRVNQGRATNLPLLVNGQSPESIQRILADEGTQEDIDIAINRALQRVSEGQELPSFESIDLAVEAAKARSDAGGSLQKFKGAESAQTQPDFPGAGIIEPARAVASGLGRTVQGGLRGIFDAADPTAEPGAGAQAVEDVKAEAFQPKTKAGKKGLETFNDLVQKGVDLANIPLSGLGGIAELVAGQGIDKAVETIKAIQRSGVGERAGERVFEETGSPLAATAAKVAPAALGLIAGPKVASTAARGAAEGVEAAGRATGKALQPAVQAGTELVSDVSRIKTPGQREIVAQLQRGEVSRDLAGVKLEGVPIKDPTPRQQLLGADLPKAVRDKPAIAAERQGFDAGFIDNVKKRSTETDRGLMREMTTISQRGKKDPLFEVDSRPADVPGKVLLEQYNQIKKINRIAGKRIGNAKKYLEGKFVETSQIGDSFESALKELKIVINKDRTLDFSDSLISGLGGRKKAITDIWNKMVKNNNPDAMDLHNLKQGIDEVVSYGKSVRGLGGKAEIALKELRSNIRTALDEFPEYKKANQVYGDTIEILDEVQRLAGKKTDLTSGSAAGQLGVLSRRLMSNAQSRGNVQEAVKQLTDVLDRHSGFGGPLRLPGKSAGKPNIKLLMLYADELDKVVGTPAKTSLGGTVGTALEFATDVPTAAVSPLSATISVAGKVARKGVGINQDNAFKSMRTLLKEGKK